MGKRTVRLNHGVDEKVEILLTFMSVELSQKWTLPVQSATSAQRVTRMPICSPLLFKPSRGKSDLILITCPWLHIGRHQSLWALPQSFLSGLPPHCLFAWASLFILLSLTSVLSVNNLIDICSSQWHSPRNTDNPQIYISFSSLFH